jgi:hypothetical protein
MEADNIRLLQAYEEIPWKELSSMRVARDLKVETGLGRSKYTAWLMG